jgi:hypothetical protein
MRRGIRKGIVTQPTEDPQREVYAPPAPKEEPAWFPVKTPELVPADVPAPRPEPQKQWGQR